MHLRLGNLNGDGFGIGKYCSLTRDGGRKVIRIRIKKPLGARKARGRRRKGL
jgi:hypothetical protein